MTRGAQRSPHLERVGRIFKRLRNDALGTVSRIATTEPVVALAFDDGPHPVYTPRVLDVLADHDAHATFFMLGVHAAAHPDVARRVAAAGHAIGNHTYDHPSFPLVGARERRQLSTPVWSWTFSPVSRLTLLARLHVGTPKFFRHGSFASHASVRFLGYETVGWSAHASDWERRDSRWIFERLLAQVKPGAIVLLHDALYTPKTPEVADRSAMIDALRMLLEALSPRYRFVTVPELLTLGRVVRSWYLAPDRAFLATLENYDRYAPPRRPPPSSST
ncbi:MAG: polysaccharide deacetylase family protein [bacterium]|nr:polysaccharide deacetylase family protein [bacterium]